jgi:hypothetical protein
MLSNPPPELVHVDRMQIRGKQERLGVWGILDPVSGASDTAAQPAPGSSGTESASPEPEPPVPA